MSRPALAAARGSEIIDFLAAHPRGRFSLTEIASATRVNRASCLAILSELTLRGHLCRHASRKTYWLGPALIAAGSAATAANPMLLRAQGSAERLRADLGLPVLLSTRIGDEIMCVFSLADDSGRTAGLHAGERVPLVPPVGASFIAWASELEAEMWIARRPDAEGQQMERQLRETLVLTKQRGFHVTLRRHEDEDSGSALARAMSGDRPPELRRQVSAFVKTLDAESSQPDMLNAEVRYDIQLIAAPVVDAETSAVYNLCVGGFLKPLSGTAIADLGRRLTSVCVKIMEE